MKKFIQLLPDTVHVVETDHDLEDGPRYWPEEHYISTAVESRQREFRTVRTCAREALALLGHGEHILVPDAQRAPVWPKDIVGSMTHCDGVRAAAVARTEHIRAIGIDAEPHDRLPKDSIDLILLPQEQEAVRQLERKDPNIAWDKLLFSAKESVFKTWFPTTRTWLDFLECEITIGEQEDEFTARILQSPNNYRGIDLSALNGRWMTEGPLGQGLIATAITVP